jgi:Mrp family chromosome partitioning ATPase/uncharacterized protein involved in exopolysaccharide biosynthesis
MLTWNEIQHILRTILRWWWVVLLATLLAGGTAFYLSRFETRYYVARTSLMIGNTLTSPLPDQNQLGIGSSLARYYGEIARREPILKPVAEELQLPFAWTFINDRMLTTNVVPNANLLEIYITDSNPERAAAIANAIGAHLIKLSPNSPDKIEAERNAIEQQLKASDAKIQELKAKIDALTARREQATSASDLTEINDQITQLNASLSQEQDSYRALLNFKNSSVTNSLSFFERALPPTQALPSKRIVAVGIASVAGMLLALAAVYVLERVDTRWRSRRDIEDRFNMSDLGGIPSGPPAGGGSAEYRKRREQAVREAHTNIMLAAANGGARTLLISSPHANPDRTSFSIDLARVFARSGHRVLMVDADLTTPSLTRLMLPDNGGWDDASESERDLWSRLRATGMPNIAMLPSSLDDTGTPALVPSLRWAELVQQLSDAADVVIFDGPSTLASADAALLAPHVDGAVLVVAPSQDSREDVEKARARLTHKPGAHLLGAVTCLPSDQRGWAANGLPKRLTGEQHLALPPVSPDWLERPRGAVVTPPLEELDPGDEAGTPPEAP